MKKQKKIEQEIERTLSLLDQRKKLPANPWFYSRVKQRLDAPDHSFNLFGTILKPAFLIILLAANLGTAIWYFRETSTDTRQELIEVLGDELNLNPDSNNLLNF